MRGFRQIPVILAGLLLLAPLLFACGCSGDDDGGTDGNGTEDDTGMPGDATQIMAARLGALVIAAQAFLNGDDPVRAARSWSFALAIVAATIATAVAADLAVTLAVVGGLIVFGIVFAFNSAIHSYLILSYSDHDKVAVNVGFYYMANAGGRLTGTVLSGWAFQQYGLEGCLWMSAAFVVMAGLVSLNLSTPSGSR